VTTPGSRARTRVPTHVAPLSAARRRAHSQDSGSTPTDLDLTQGPVDPRAASHGVARRHRWTTPTPIRRPAAPGHAGAIRPRRRTMFTVKQRAAEHEHCWRYSTSATRTQLRPAESVRSQQRPRPRPRSRFTATASIIVPIPPEQWRPPAVRVGCRSLVAGDHRVKRRVTGDQGRHGTAVRQRDSPARLAAQDRLRPGPCLQNGAEPDHHTEEAATGVPRSPWHPRLRWICRGGRSRRRHRHRSPGRPICWIGAGGLAGRSSVTVTKLILAIPSLLCTRHAHRNSSGAHRSRSWGPQLLGGNRHRRRGATCSSTSRAPEPLARPGARPLRPAPPVHIASATRRLDAGCRE
jgi:hypothetical protein